MDIDIDLSSHKRDLVFEKVSEYINSIGGTVVRVGTFKTESPKSAIQTACRGLGIPSDVGLFLSSLIPVVRGNTRSLHDTYYGNLEEGLPPVVEFARQIDRYEGLLETAMGIEDLVSGRSSHACFDGDTLVETFEGIKKIKEVNVGDKVLTHTGSYKEVVKTMSHKTDDTYIVKARGSFDITTTSNHPFYVRTRPNTRSSKTRSNKPTWVEVNKIKKGDYIGQPINEESIIPCGGLPFNNTSFWWLVGRYLGDGWNEAPKRKGEVLEWDKRTIVCCDKRTTEELNEITTHLNNLPFKWRVYEANSTYKIVFPYSKNKELYEYLESFGKYAYGKRLNKDVIKLPIILLESFFEGYMSADGSYVASSDTYSFKTVSKELAMGLQHVVAKLYKRHCSIHVGQARDEMFQGVRRISRKKSYQLTFRKEVGRSEQSFYEDGYIWCEVREVEKIGDFKEVYNLTVLDDSSYTVNRVAVHNCGVVQTYDILDSTALMKAPSGEWITQYDLGDCESSGLIKFDFLNTKTMGMIQICMEMLVEYGHMEWQGTLRKTYDKYLHPNNLDPNNPKYFDVLNSGGLLSAFQFDSIAGEKALRAIKPQSLLELANANSLMRLMAEDGEQPIDMYVRYKNDPTAWEKDMVRFGLNEQERSILHKHLDKDFGVCSSQEGMMLITMDEQVANFSVVESNKLRKGVAKKVGSLYEQAHELFYEKGLNLGRRDRLLDYIWDVQIAMQKG